MPQLYPYVGIKGATFRKSLYLTYNNVWMSTKTKFVLLIVSAKFFFVGLWPNKCI